MFVTENFICENSGKDHGAANPEYGGIRSSGRRGNV